MKKEDLLKMLDLAGKEPEPPKPDVLNITREEPKATKRRAPASLTALDLDDWALRKGKDVLAGSKRLQSLHLGEHAVADFFAAAFLHEPQLREECVDPCRREFLAQLLEMPEYQALHASTTLREAESTVAATSFAEQFATLKGKPTETEAAEPAGEGDMEREMDTLRAVDRALTEASEQVEEMREAAAMGMGPGSPGSNDPHAIASLYRRVRGNPTLQRICELAGRYRRVAQSKQRQKVSHGMDDLVGVTLAGDLGRVLPVELAKLAMPELEWDTLRRLVERQCMAREYHSVEPIAKGPILVCVDESGSMQGNKVHTAKALALALAWIARQQNRWCALVAYSGDSGERLLALPPSRWNEDKLADWLSEFIGCGSSLDIPVREIPGYYRMLKAPRGRTDLLFITDAICHIPREIKDRFLEWKHTVQARLISLVIGSQPGDLLTISDECHKVNTLEVTEEAVERVLAI